MKVHLSWFRVVVAVATATGTLPAVAQYAPYRPAQQAPVGYTGAMQPGTVPAGQPAQSPQPQQQPTMGQTAYQPTQQYVAAVPQQTTYGGYPTQGYPQAYAPQGYPQGYPAYPQMAAQAGTPATPPQSSTSGQVETMPTPAAPSSQAGSMSMSPAQSNGAAMPGMSAEAMGYPSAGQPGCNTGSGYPTTGYAGGNCYGSQDNGLSGYFDNAGCGGGSQWFGGAYYLFMQRDSASFQRTTVMAAPSAYPYYPLANTTVLSTANVDYDFNSGVEIRFGSTFSVGSGCDSSCNGYGNGYSGCNTGCATSPMLFAWEAALWGLDGENQWFQVTDTDMTDSNRIYGMVNHAGLQYDDGGGNRPVNEYYDYQMPIQDDNPPNAGDYRVFSQRIRTNFRAQNVELNFLRIPVCDMGCTSVANSCNNDTLGYSACSNGYGAGCQTPTCGASGPAFTMAALCGFRYFHMKDSFELATNDYTYNGGAWVDTAYGWDMFDDIQIENNLAGFQLGMNMNYCVACKWNVFADSSFGLYNNHMTQDRRVYGPTGYAEFMQEARDARINSSKDDLSFLGELRVGGSYDISCNWRAVLAYRAVAITGVGLASNQFAGEMSNWAEASRINSDGSIIIHGVQTGVECRY